MSLSYRYDKGNIAILRNSMCQRVKKQCVKFCFGDKTKAYKVEVYFSFPINLILNLKK